MKNFYGFGEIFKNLISIVYTKLFYPDARLIRRPIYVRGKKLLCYKRGFTTGYGCRLEMFDLGNSNRPKLNIGENCKMGDYVHIAAGEQVIIGDNCLIASKVYISDIIHGDYRNSNVASSPEIPPDKRPLFTKPVKIGENVWLGDNVCILPGVTVGNGSIIGANSVVSHNIDENSIAVGAPAIVIKHYNFDKCIWQKDT